MKNVYHIDTQLERAEKNLNMPSMNKSILDAAYKITRSLKPKALFISLDALQEIPDDLPKNVSIIFITRKNNEDFEKFFLGGVVPEKQRLLALPKVDMTRMSQIKMALMLALSNNVITIGDKVVFVTGLPDKEELDSIISIDTRQESEVLSSTGLQLITDNIKPEVFQSVLSIALELASRGREGKPIGTTFVIGNEEKVLQLSKQMIINPFKGYTDQERNVLNPGLRETLREFAALDGAFVISGDGLVLTAGRYLGAASDEATIPRGLGSRHIAAAGITALTEAVAIVISESTGDVRIFKSGKVLMEIEKPTRVPTPI